MTDDDLRKAADRVMQAAQEFPNDDWLSQATVTAADELAVHVQRLYDPTPVDEEWLKAVGFFGRDGVYRKGKLCVECYESDEWTMWLREEMVKNGSITRGDVRRLCEVFGIKLKETT